MHNINFHKRRALYLKHLPDMSKEHQRLYQILPEQEPKVGTVEEEIEFVERVIREREEAQVGVSCEPGLGLTQSIALARRPPLHPVLRTVRIMRVCCERHGASQRTQWSPSQFTPSPVRFV